MPKNYNDTIIYKITCRELDIKDIYVGHTTNFVQRKHSHKQGCNNPKTSNYNCKLYNTIREKGGWSNWKMEIVDFFNCVDHYEARQKEQEYFISLNANLNSIEPMPKPKPEPLVTINNQQLLASHQNCECKIIETASMLNDISQKKTNYICNICLFNTCNKKDYNRHILTQKHKTLTTPIKIPEKISNYICKCGKIYKHNSTLCAHKKNCKINCEKYKVHETDSSLIVGLLKQNQEFKELLLEQHNKLIEVCKNN